MVVETPRSRLAWIGSVATHWKETAWMTTQMGRNARNIRRARAGSAASSVTRRPGGLADTRVERVGVDRYHLGRPSAFARVGSARGDGPGPRRLGSRLRLPEAEDEDERVPGQDDARDEEEERVAEDRQPCADRGTGDPARRSRRP